MNSERRKYAIHSLGLSLLLGVSASCLAQTVNVGGILYDTDGTTPLANALVNGVTTGSGGEFTVSESPGLIRLDISQGDSASGQPIYDYYMHQHVLYTETNKTDLAIGLPEFEEITIKTTLNGSPLADQQFHVNLAIDGTRLPYWPLSFPAEHFTTGIDGTAKVWVRPGDRVETYFADYEAGSVGDYISITPIQTVPVSDGDVLEYAMAPAHTLDITLTESDGSTPVASEFVSVHFSGERSFFPFSGMTDAAGQVSIVLPEGVELDILVPVMNGNYSEYPLASNFVLSADDTISLSLPETYTIDGTITDSGTPVDGLSAGLYLLLPGSSEPRFLETAWTDSSGAFAFTNEVVDGDYQIQIGLIGGYFLADDPCGPDQTRIHPFTVSGNTAVPLQVQFCEEYLAEPHDLALGFPSSDLKDVEARVEWGANTGYPTTISWGIDDLSENEIVLTDLVAPNYVLTGLTPETTYMVQVTIDRNGELWGQSAVETFTTLALDDGQLPQQPPVATIVANNYYWVTLEYPLPPGTSRCYPQGDYGFGFYTSVNPGLKYVLEDGTYYVTLRYDLNYLGITGSVAPGADFPIRLAAYDSFEGQYVYSSTFYATRPTHPTGSKPLFVSGPLIEQSLPESVTLFWQADKEIRSYLSLLRGSAMVQNDVGKGTVFSRLSDGLTAGQTYDAEVLIYDFVSDTAAAKSLTFSTPSGTDTTAPAITDGPIVASIDETSATIEWTTDEISSGLVEYGIDPATDLTSLSTPEGRNHSIQLTGLTADTVYAFQVIATDVDNNGPTVSDLDSFTTLQAPDTTAPTILAGPDVAYASDDIAVITWVTDELSDSYVQYGTYEGFLDQEFSDSELAFEHTAILSELIAGETYYFEVSSTDAAGNTVTAVPDTKGWKASGSFQTEVSSDSTAPVITADASVAGTASQSIVLNWTTDEIADSRVRYNLEGQPLTINSGAGGLSKDHVITLTNLQPGTSYDIQVGSADAEGNGPTWGSVITAQTNAASDTTDPDILDGPTVTVLSETAATVEWTTDENATSRVLYGTAASPRGSTLSLAGYRTDHLLTMSQIAPGSLIYYRVESIDPSGNKVSSEGSFTTGILLNAGNTWNLYK